MALFPLMTDRHHLVERPYYSNPEDLHGLHIPSHWHSFQSKPFPSNPTSFLAAESILASPFCWDAQISSNPGVGSTHMWHHHDEPSHRTANIPSDSRFSSAQEYPESSQRTVLPTTPPIGASKLYGPPQSSPSSSSSSSYNRDFSRSSSSGASEFNDNNVQCQWGSALYTIDEPEVNPEPISDYRSSLSAATKAGSISLPAVKVEPDEGEDNFIMELATIPDATLLSQSLAPPTEVPLRATQASKEMREMMNVFRINPFAMHSAGRGAVPLSSWYPGEAGPLMEEPLMFEFQLELDGVESAESEDPCDGEEGECGSEEDETGFGVDQSIEFDVGGGDNEDVQAREGELGEAPRPADDCQWERYRSQPTMLGAAQIHPPAWEMEYPATASASGTSGLLLQRSSRLNSPFSRRNYHKTTDPDHDDVISANLTKRNHHSLELNQMRLRKPTSEPSSWEPYMLGVSSNTASRYGSSYVHSVESQCESPGAEQPALEVMSRAWR